MYKKKFPIILAAVIVAISVFLMWHNTTAKEMDYYEYAEDLELIKVIDSTDLTMDMIAARNGKLIIEKAVGVVTDAETGAGYVLGYPDFYISYASVEDIQNGDVICTYFVYNPDSDYEDDILMRFDYIIDVVE